MAVAINANNDRQWARLARVIGRPDLADAPEYRMPERVKHGPEIYPLISAWVGEHTVAEVEEALVAAGVPCAPILNTRQIVEHPMIRGRGSIITIPWGDREIAMVDALPRLSETPGRVRRPGPRPGEHTREVLEEAGLSAGEIEALASSGAIGPLAQDN